MGRYPDEMIHCIYVKQCTNICWYADVIAKGYNQYRLKHELNPISRYIIRLAEPDYSMKKKELCYQNHKL